MKTTQTFAVRFIALPKTNDPTNAYIDARITVSKSNRHFSSEPSCVLCGIQKKSVLSVKLLKPGKSINLLTISATA
jgi:hypothetical protein